MYQLLLNKIDKGACLVDENLNVKGANRSFLDLFQIDDEDIDNLEKITSSEVDLDSKTTTLEYGSLKVEASIESSDNLYLITIENRVKDIFDSGIISTMTYECLDKLIITKTSTNIKNIFGYSKDELENISYIDLIYPDDFFHFKKENLKSINIDSFERNPYRIIDSKGEIKWIYEKTKILQLDENTTFQSYLIDITKIKELELVNRELYDKYELITKNSKDGFWQWDLEDDRVHYSKEYLKILGYESFEFKPSLYSWLDVTHIDDKNSVINTLDKSLASNSFFELSYRVKTKNRGYVWIFNRAKAVDTKNGKKVLGYITDLSEKLNLEAEVQMQKEFLQNIIDTNPNLISVKNWNGKYILVNRAFASMLNLEPKDIISKTDFDLLDYEVAEKIFLKDREALSSNEKFQFEEKLKLNDKLNWFQVIKIPLKKNQQIEHRLLLSISSNITEHKELSERLKESEERFKLALDGSGDGLWDIDLNTKQIYYSPKWFEILGYKDKELSYSLESFEKTCHKLDYKRVLKYILNSIDHRENFEIVYRGIRKDNRVIWLQSKGKVFKNRRTIGHITDITKQKDYENKLKSSKELIKSILQSSVSAIMGYSPIKDENGKIVDFECVLSNNSARRITSIPHQELINKTMLTNFPKIKGSLFIKYRDAVLYNKSIRFETKYKVRNEYKWLEISAVGLNNHLTINFLDITKRKIYEKSIKTLNTELEKKAKLETIKRKELDLQYKTIFDNAVIGIMMLDLDGGIINCNIAFENMLGFSKDELKEKSFMDITYHENRERDRKYFDAIKRDDIEFYQIEKHYVKKNKSTLLTKLIVSGIKDTNNNLKYMLAMAEDITEKKELEDKQKEQENMLIQQSKMASMGEMIGIIAHQWKQPLNVLSILIQDLEDLYRYDELTTEELDDIVSTSLKEINFMASTIDDFRNFFKPSKQKTKFNLLDSILEIEKILKPQFIKYNIEVKIECDKDISILGFGNEFKQVILNIINNAKDAIEEKKLTDGFIKIKSKKENNRVILTIEDNGGGIPESILNDIFNPYITTKGEKGTGIGLYMSKMIIQNMSANLFAKNTEYGAKFYIEFNNIDNNT